MGRASTHTEYAVAVRATGTGIPQVSGSRWMTVATGDSASPLASTLRSWGPLLSAFQGDAVLVRIVTDEDGETICRVLGRHSGPPRGKMELDEVPKPLGQSSRDLWMAAAKAHATASLPSPRPPLPRDMRSLGIGKGPLAAIAATLAAVAGAVALTMMPGDPIPRDGQAARILAESAYRRADGGTVSRLQGVQDALRKRN